MPVEVAAFDVDGTLTVRDCVVPFMREVGGVSRLSRGALGSPVPFAKALGRRDRDGIKAMIIRSTFTGLDVQQVRDRGVMYAAKVVERWIRPDVAARLRWHQREGHVTVLVSASLEPYLHPLGDFVGVDAVLCTELEESDGRYTGEIRGANCRGPEKVRRLSRWLEEAGLGGVRPAFAYGDSSGDRQLLEYSSRPFHVRKSDLSLVPGP